MTPNEFCLLHIFGLKYGMAGDFESMELLEKLEERRLTIEWDSPDFISHSESMRGDPAPSILEINEQATVPQLFAWIYGLTEQLAKRNEQASHAIALSERVLAKSEKFLDLHAKMIHRLETLGADTTEFRLPPAE